MSVCNDSACVLSGVFEFGRVALGVPEVYILGRPGSGRILFCTRLHSCLPFAFASSLPSTSYVPVLPPSVFLSLSTAVSFFYVPLLFYGIHVSLSTNLISILDMSAHEPPLQGAGCMLEVLFWFALPAVWFLVFFQK